MINRLYLFVASAFPGAYRFLSIYLIAYVCNYNVANFFSEMFFWVNLLVTFTGMAVATQAYKLEMQINIIKQFYLVIVFTLLIIPVVYFFKEDFDVICVIIVSSLFLSFFEVVRANLIAVRDYKSLFKSGCIASIFVIIVIIIFKDNKLLLVLSVFFGLLLSVTFFIGNDVFLKSNYKIEFSTIKDVMSYSLSNGFSTGLTFLIPILLIREVGQLESQYIAQTVSLTSVFLLYPKYLLANFLGVYKLSQDFALAVNFEKRLIFFSFILILIFLVSVNFLPVFSSDYQIIFVSMITSQLALPYSGVLMVQGKGINLLQINFFSMIFLFLSGFFVYSIFERGEERAFYLMLTYLIYVILRGLITKEITKKLASSFRFERSKL